MFYRVVGGECEGVSEGERVGEGQSEGAGVAASAEEHVTECMLSLIHI